jgi:hypothetical protein
LLCHAGQLARRQSMSLMPKIQAVETKRGGIPLRSRGGLLLRARGGIPLRYRGGIPLRSRGGIPLRSRGGIPLRYRGGLLLRGASCEGGSPRGGLLTRESPSGGLFFSSPPSLPCTPDCFRGVTLQLASLVRTPARGVSRRWSRLVLEYSQPEDFRIYFRGRIPVTFSVSTMPSC